MIERNFNTYRILSGRRAFHYLQLADAEAEAKDNFKYLQTIQQSYDALYKGSPKEILTALPVILAGTHTMHDMARSISRPSKSLLPDSEICLLSSMHRNSVEPSCYCCEKVTKGWAHQQVLC